MSGDSLLWLIEDKMATLIGGINAQPYNYVWGTVNERDNAKSTFPSANVYCEQGTNLDDPNGPWAGSYFEEVLYRIEVLAQMDQQYENPQVQIRRDLYKALDDLKMLFGKNYNIDGTCDTIMFKDFNIEEYKSGDILIPAKLITHWSVRYESDRSNPTQTVQ